MYLEILRAYRGKRRGSQPIMGTWLEAAGLRQQGIVAVCGVDVQRKVGGVNRQVPVHGGFQLPVGDAGNGLHGLPENAVVKKEQVRTCFQGRMNGLF